MRRFCFVVNPVAGKGRGKKVIPQLVETLSRKKLPSSVEVTRYHGEATLIARRAAESSDVVVAVGGDGTVNEVANGIMNSGKALGVIPVGSGNDFVKMFQIPLNLEEAVDALADAETCLIDVGEISIYDQTDASSPRETRYFVNGVGIGFDAAVACESMRMKHLRGLPLYISALLRALMKFKTPQMQLQFGDVCLNGKHFLVAIGNGTCAGGGFYLTPDAKVDDGVFDVCAVGDVSIPRVLQIFPSVLKGRHTAHPEVSMFKTNGLRVVSQDPLVIHADGEVLGDSARRVEITLIEKTLLVAHGSTDNNAFS